MTKEELLEIARGFHSVIEGIIIPPTPREIIMAKSHLEALAEIERLKKKVGIATKAIRQFTWGGNYGLLREIAEQALKELEG